MFISSSPGHFGVGSWKEVSSSDLCSPLLIYKGWKAFILVWYHKRLIKYPLTFTLLKHCVFWSFLFFFPCYVRNDAGEKGLFPSLQLFDRAKKSTRLIISQPIVVFPLTVHICCYNEWRQLAYSFFPLHISGAHFDVLTAISNHMPNCAAKSQKLFCRSPGSQSKMGQQTSEWICIMGL